MRTEKQIEASRANGARSNGPTTPEGKVVSSRNATTHGLTSRHPLLLNVEQQSAFQDHLVGYINWLKPVGPVETDVVEEMVTTQWRRQRGEAMEATLVQLAMDRMAADVDKQFNNCPHSTRIAMAMEHLEEKGRALGNFQRHSLRLSRQFLRLHKALRELQADRNSIPVAEPQPDPTPEPEPAPAPSSQNEQIEPKDRQGLSVQVDTDPPTAIFASGPETNPSTKHQEEPKCAGN